MTALAVLKQCGRAIAPNLHRRYVEHQRASLLHRVSAVVSEPSASVTLNETEFDDLQRRYKQWWAQYDFDAYSTGRRAYERALSFLKLEPLRIPGKNVLEIACGDGMSGTALSIYGHHVTLLDYQDWRDSRAQRQQFVKSNLSEPIPLPNSSYDFIFSFNAFEHIPDPALAMNEMVRVLKPGGLILIDFNPLYASPLGLHAFCFTMPYPQFLFSDEIISLKLKSLGLNDLGKVMDALQPLNRWRIQQFRALWRRSDCEIIEYNEIKNSNHLDMVFKYPQAFRGRGLLSDDLVVEGMRVVLRKN